MGRVAPRRRLVVAALTTLSVLGATALAPTVAGGQEVPRPPGQDFVITPGDLDFVLDQIAISEAHARRVATENPDASPLCSPQATFDDTLHGQMWLEPNGDPCVGSPLLPFGLRTVDGRWNNLQAGQSYYGAGGQMFPRLLEPEMREADPVPPGAPVVPGQPTNPTSYAQTDGFVYDAHPREISNLVVDQTTANPAAVAKVIDMLGEGLDADVLDAAGAPEDLDGLAVSLGKGDATELTVEEIQQAFPNQRIFIQNVATDEGLSAPFSSFMTIFGQFFDHGLDLVDKGGNGTVVVPLAPDDPLVNHPDFDPSFPYLLLTRATQYPDGSGVVQNRNRTTPFIDQNQTYTSHPSHQVFLRGYELVEGRPVPTGALLDGPDGGLATWATVKAQARELLGIQLEDHHAVTVPLLRTDPYGRFVPDPDTGFPQVATTEGFVSGTPEDPVDLDDPIAESDTDETLFAGQSFLDDIAHSAVPVSDTGAPRPLEEYDATLLDDHFVTGDGRGNENIGLTAVHHVFHSEHNRLLGQISEVIAEDAGEGADGFGLAERFAADGFWDEPERMFQAARFFNEMQYQHLAVEEFLRTVAPTMDNQPLNESAYHSELNAAITAEFAHVVYRFGHSMLTETLPRTYADGSTGEVTLLDGFLSPRSFTEDGNLPPDEAAGSLIMGLARQVGNGIDEFVTETLRNNLLGLPLDLATINMTRARDAGVPPLQSARAQFYAATLDPTLKPYANWEDFKLELKHPESIVNFIAAYGIHPTLDAAQTLDAKRAAATVLAADPAFMLAPSAESGLDQVDFWVGGLAERTMVFGGMLGSTFNFVFESQAELLQNADRFYYLTRTQGRNFLSQLEGNSFSELIQRNTTVEAVPLDIFAFPGLTFYLQNMDPEDESTWLPHLGFTFLNGAWRYQGEEHVVVHGSDRDDPVHVGVGDDTIWGRTGNDVIEGDDGADSIIGGDGNDRITDVFGDDKIIGGAGNDAIRSGPGTDLVLAGSGSDLTMLTKDDFSNNFNGPGNDFVLGGTGSDRIWGGDGDDWLEGGEGHDLVQGDNALLFQNDPNGGHDVLIGGPGNNDQDSDGGDDIMVGTPGVDRNEGMLGFDWVTYKGHDQPVIADMRFTGLMPPDIGNMRDRFDLVEGLSGWDGDDILRGLTGIDDIVEGGDGHLLTEEHIARTAGLAQLLRPGAPHIDYACRFMGLGGCGLPGADTDGTPNIILGGGGSDLIEGRAGDDFIDGDMWLDVQIRWDPTPGADGDEQYFDSLAQIGDRVLAGEVLPEHLSIFRSVKQPVGQGNVVDTAVYTTNSTEYEVRWLGEGGEGSRDYWEVFHSGAAELEESDGRDVLRNIEWLQFPDRCVVLDGAAQGVTSPADLPDCPTAGSIELSNHNPVENEPLTATATIDPAITNPTDLVWEWQFGEDGEEFEPATGTQVDDGLQSTYTPTDPDAGNHLRAILTFTDDQGVRRSIVSPRTLNPVVGVNDAPTGPEIVPAQPVVGDVLTAINLADEDGIEGIVEDGLVTYEWQANSGDGATDWTTVQSNDQPFFLVPAELEGRQVRVIAHYTDDMDTAESAVSAPTPPIGAQTPNADPEGNVVVTPMVPEVGEEMVADVSGISDPDGIMTDAEGNPLFSFQWQWEDEGVWTAVPGATAMIYTPTAEQVGGRLRVQVVFTDGRGAVYNLFSAETDPVTEAEPPPPAAPVVDGFTPTEGGAGTQVTITGSGFTGTTTVTFGGFAATFTEVSDTELQAVVPDGAVTGPVAVTAAGGSASSATDFVVPTTPPTGAGVRGDFDGDGTVDLAVFRPSNGRWYIRGGDAVTYGMSGDVPVPADYDGDGTTDLSVFRPSNGRWYVRGVPGFTTVGAGGDIPVPGDYDGDGTVELVVFRPSNGRWYTAGAPSVAFGVAGDVPVPGDYDGDGTVERAVFRPSNGRWYVQGAAASIPYGMTGDVPVAADHDGDGALDLAVFRPSNGRWYVRGTAGSTPHGASGDIPVPADHDGDGTLDLAVFRPSNGRWYVQGTPSTAFGMAGDVPLLAAPALIHDAISP